MSVTVTALTRRLAATPADFLAPGTVAPAVLADAVFTVHGVVLHPGDAAVVAAAAVGPGAVATAVAAWLLTEADLSATVRDTGPAGALAVVSALVTLAADVPPVRWVAVGERREEVARTALAALGVVPAGDSVAQAQDRLLAVSSSARRAAVAAATAAERRARAIAEALATKRAAEAAARYSSY